MTVAQLGKINNGEFVRWQIYYARQAQRIELERLKAKG